MGNRSEIPTFRRRRLGGLGDFEDFIDFGDAVDFGADLNFDPGALDFGYESFNFDPAGLDFSADLTFNMGAFDVGSFDAGALMDPGTFTSFNLDPAALDLTGNFVPDNVDFGADLMPVDWDVSPAGVDFSTNQMWSTGYIVDQSGSVISAPPSIPGGAKVPSSGGGGGGGSAPGGSAPGGSATAPAGGGSGLDWQKAAAAAAAAGAAFFMQQARAGTPATGVKTVTLPDGKTVTTYPDGHSVVTDASGRVVARTGATTTGTTLADIKAYAAAHPGIVAVAAAGLLFFVMPKGNK